MNTVWKYMLPLDQMDGFTLIMPQGAEVVEVAVQGGAPCLWAVVDPDAPKEPRQFAVTGTGHPCPSPSEARYLGLFMLDGGAFVGHLWEPFDG